MPTPFTILPKQGNYMNTHYRPPWEQGRHGRLGTGWHERQYLKGLFLDNFLKGLPISVKEITQTFELLKASAPSIYRWVPIANNCRTLASHSFCWRFREYEEELLEEWYQEDGIDELLYMHIERVRIPYFEGDTVPWSAFWWAAHAWAYGQHSPTQLQEYQRQLEKTASEKRLRNYFFGSNWSSLPERAQQALITADSNWNSQQRIRQASILNELLRASEEMCDHFIWQPLISEGTTSSDILDIEARVAKSGYRSDLGVREYIDICELKSLPGVLKDRKLPTSEIEFMIQSLPAALKKLAGARNTSEHEIGASVPRDTLASFFNGFLGIGQPGILPQLARIGRKLQISTD